MSIADLKGMLPAAEAVGPGYTSRYVTDSADPTFEPGDNDDNLAKQCPELAELSAAGGDEKVPFVEQDYDPAKGESMLTVDLHAGGLAPGIRSESQLRRFEKAINGCGTLHDEQHPSEGTAGQGTFTFKMRDDDTYGEFGAVMTSTMSMSSQSPGMSFGLNATSTARIFKVGDAWAMVMVATQPGSPARQDGAANMKPLDHLAGLVEAKMRDAQHH